ncbi:MAG: hypothetical protein CMJ32_06915 [Phycisphaerae bacterium]|nr:hypothetical protein [Phycisphaerae bacterium]
MFAKKPGQRLLNVTEQLIMESGWLAQAIERDHFQFKDFQVNHKDVATKQLLHDHTVRFLANLPSSDKDWLNTIDQNFAEAESSKENRNLLVAANFIACSCVKLDIAAKATLQFPNSKPMSRLINMGVTTMLVSLSVVFPGRSSDGLFEPISTQRFGVVYPSTLAKEILMSMPRTEIVFLKEFIK